MIYPRDLEHSRLYPLVLLERFVSHRMRHRVQNITLVVIAIFVVFGTLIYAANTAGVLPEPIRGTVLIFFPYAVGLICLLLGVWLIFFLFEGYFRSHYFKEKETARSPRAFTDQEVDRLSFTVGRILFLARKDDDITGAFITSPIGSRVLLRCGLRDEDQRHYLSQRESLASYELDLDQEHDRRLFTLTDLAQQIFEKDTEFADFLVAQGVTEGTFVGAAQWVMREREQQRLEERWWRWSRLKQVPGIARDWAYGGAYDLQNYAREMVGAWRPGAYRTGAIKREDELTQLENILSRGNKANALLVGDIGTVQEEILRMFAHRIENNSVPATLEHKRMWDLDTDLLVSQTGDKASFERELITVTDDAIEAGNSILVIKNLPAFVKSAEMLGSNIASVLEPALSSEHLQVIATSSTNAFHNILSRDALIGQYFDRVSVEETGYEASIATLERVAREHERTHPVLLTYAAIESLVKNADRYITEGTMPDKAVDLLDELVSSVLRNKKKKLITANDVAELVRLKTDVPVGEIKEKEREKLANLEEELHERVIGQDEAVRAVSRAMRRAYAGTRDPDRPIGTFLFLGPTGVGKTETTKALAEAFFGSDERMSRIDMSEYQSEGALARLIGSAEDNTPGALVQLLKEQPHGVVLLDEFEKTHPQVLDLFLQILDEGFFTDAFGKRINARNSIIIATSNAGSDIIWRIVEEGKASLQERKHDLLDELIEENTFKPELLNRFDSVVLYHPLEQTHLKRIADKMLRNLKERLKDRHLELVVNNDLVAYVMAQEYKQAFGARPMQRFIENEIEHKIAEKLISGELEKGSTVRFTKEGEIMAE